jgi:hypothetical protein
MNELMSMNSFTSQWPDGVNGRLELENPQISVLVRSTYLGCLLSCMHRLQKSCGFSSHSFPFEAESGHTTILSTDLAFSPEECESNVQELP